MNLECQTCKKTFSSDRKQKYCSRKCSVIKFTIQCVRCGKSHATARRDAKYCSTECANKSQSEVEPATCEACGIVFQPRNGNRYRRFCSRECGFKRDMSVEIERLSLYVFKADPFTAVKNRLKYRVKWYQSRYRRALERCDMCRSLRGWADAKGPSSIFCAECRPHMQRLGSEGISTLASPICMDCQKPRDMSTRKTRSGKRCDDCEYQLKRERKAASGKVRRARKYHNGRIDKDITLKKLSNRDGGACYLCGLLVDWSDDPWSGGKYPNIEHVVPLSKGGTHTWDNVKLACSQCNTDKGDSAPVAVGVCVQYDNET